MSPTLNAVAFVALDRALQTSPVVEPLEVIDHDFLDLERDPEFETWLDRLNADARHDAHEDIKMPRDEEDLADLADAGTAFASLEERHVYAEHPDPF